MKHVRIVLAVVLALTGCGKAPEDWLGQACVERALERYGENLADGVADRVEQVGEGRYVVSGRTLARGTLLRTWNCNATMNGDGTAQLLMDGEGFAAPRN